MSWLLVVWRPWSHCTTWTYHRPCRILADGARQRLQTSLKVMPGFALRPLGTEWSSGSHWMSPMFVPSWAMRTGPLPLESKIQEYQFTWRAITCCAPTPKPGILIILISGLYKQGKYLLPWTVTGQSRWTRAVLKMLQPLSATRTSLWAGLPVLCFAQEITQSPWGPGLSLGAWIWDASRAQGYHVSQKTSPLLWARQISLHWIIIRLGK